MGHETTIAEVYKYIRQIKANDAPSLSAAHPKRLNLTEFVFIMAGGPPLKEGERRAKRYQMFHKAGKDLHLKRTVLKAQSYFYCTFNKTCLQLVHHGHFDSDCAASLGVLCVLVIFIAW